MENEKTIAALNNLIEINNDRIEGYETASKETEEGDLLSLFSQFQGTSENCKSALTSEVLRLGGTPVEGTKISGKFFRVWMDVKAALFGKDRKVILENCEFGEDVAKKNYEETLENADGMFSFEQTAMLQEQHLLIKADHDKVKMMVDALA